MDLGPSVLTGTWEALSLQTVPWPSHQLCAAFSFVVEIPLKIVSWRLPLLPTDFVEIFEHWEMVFEHWEMVLTIFLLSIYFFF